MRGTGVYPREVDRFAVALCIWQEYEEAELRPPFFVRLTAGERLGLARVFLDVEGALAPSLGRQPTRAEVACEVSRRYWSRDPIKASARDQVRRLLLAAESRAAQNVTTNVTTASPETRTAP